ncbi:lactonase family protein [Microbacterium deminutum]|uniref:Lactonase family protein n=1 Tax=Microbacterium deminutum TaxID=344164 RepID=A0ABP5BYZ6_9MICO
MRFWLGAYTADMDGVASGIGTLLAGSSDDASAGGPLGYAGEVAAADSPSWLAAHPQLDVIYAALEDTGAVQAFRRTGEAAFVRLGDLQAAGKATCHIAVAPDGGSLVATCWGDGRVVRMTLDAEGRPSAPVIADAATDPYGSDAAGAQSGDVDLGAAAAALRAAAGAEYANWVPSYAEDPREVADPASVRPSRAHQATFLPDGHVATTDMGLDLVRFWRQAPSGLRQVQQVVLPLGAGPRHLVPHPSGHLFVVTELSCEVFVLAADAAGAWRIVGGTSLSADTLPGDTAAEITTSRDGEFVYAGVRGSNTLATLRVRGQGDVVSPVALTEAGVDWPRHHVVVRDTLLVAGERSNEIVSLTLDHRTGAPGRVRHRAPAPSPTCLLPVRLS